LNNITSELESATEIIGILKEELGIADTEVSDNTSIVQNNENGTYTPPSERNWIQIQTNQHKMIDTLKYHRATSLRTNNRFEVLSNLKETNKPTETVKEQISVRMLRLCRLLRVYLTNSTNTKPALLEIIIFFYSLHLIFYENPTASGNTKVNLCSCQRPMRAIYRITVWSQ
jgi:hypothetical protein